jgi:hypothetical protein
MLDQATQDTLMTAEDNTESESSATQDTTPEVSDQQGSAETEEVVSEENQPEEEATETETEIDYEFTFEEGIEIDADTLTNLKDLSKDLGLSQEAAQKVADLGALQAQRWAEQQQQAMQTAQAEWVDQVKSDKEIGGDALTENLSVAKSALARFGTPELTQLLDESGLGNHPEMIRAFHRIGKSISDDVIVAGGRGTNQPPDPAKRLYDKSNLV